MESRLQGKGNCSRQQRKTNHGAVTTIGKSEICWLYLCRGCVVFPVSNLVGDVFQGFKIQKNRKQTMVVCPPQGFLKLCGSYHCRGFIVFTLSNLMGVTTIEDSETLQVISHHYRGFIIFTLSYFMDVSAIGVCKLAEQIQRWMGGQNGAPLWRSKLVLAMNPLWGFLDPVY